MPTWHKKYFFFFFLQFYGISVFQPDLYNVFFHLKDKISTRDTGKWTTVTTHGQLIAYIRQTVFHKTDLTQQALYSETLFPERFPNLINLIGPSLIEEVHPCDGDKNCAISRPKKNLRWSWRMLDSHCLFSAKVSFMTLQLSLSSYRV